MKTVFITGASSGIGKAAALYFQSKGWNVAATMRNPVKEKELKGMENVKVLKLDVTDPSSIENAIDNAVAAFGRIDVLINNAGYGVTGPFEATTPTQLRDQFEVNVFGVMNVTKAILPYFRAQESGMIINISSLGGRVSVPLYSLYFSTKFAIEGFTETLRYEVRPFNITVKLIEPGATRTDFAGRSQVVADASLAPDYKPYVEKVKAKTRNAADRNNSSVDVVAKTIFKAATDGKQKLRYPCAGGAKTVLLLRRILGYRLFTFLVRKIME